MSPTTSGMSPFKGAMGMRAAAFALIVAMVAGCSGSNTAAPPPASGSTAVTATIGVNGGTVTGPDGVQVVIPAGALTADTTIGIARTSAGAPATLPDGSSPAGGIYEFTPHDLAFHKPVTIRMPIPANGVGAEVFMASLGADWQINDATVNGGFAEWERNSFSFGMVPVCAPPAGDLYPCVYPKGYAIASAIPTTAITKQTSGYPGLNTGSAGSWVANGAGSLTLTLNYQAAPDCIVLGPDAARAKLIRWNPDVPVNSPNRGLQTLFDDVVGLTLTNLPLPNGAPTSVWWASRRFPYPRQPSPTPPTRLALRFPAIAQAIRCRAEETSSRSSGPWLRPARPIASVVRSQT